MFFIEYFRLRLKVTRNAIISTGIRAGYKSIIRLFIVTVAIVGLYIFLVRMFGFAEARGIGHGFKFAGAFLSFSLFILMPLLVFSAIVTGLNFLFNRKELALFFASPTHHIYVFVVKFWRVFANTSWASFFVILAFIAAIQRFFETSWLIYPIGFLGLAAFLIIPVSVGVTITLILCRIFPFYRAKEMLTALGLLTAALIVAMLRFLRPERLITQDGKMVMLKFMDNIQMPWLTVLPNEWLTNICAGFYQANLKASLDNLGALWTFAGALLILTIAVAWSFYFKCVDRAWSTSMPLKHRKPVFLPWMKRFIPEPLILLAKKDFLNLYRDAVQRSSFLILIMLCAVYFFNIYAIPTEDVFSSFFRVLFNYFLASVVIVALGGRLVFASISSEGHNFRLFRSSPMRIEQFLSYRFILGFIPLLLLAEFLTIVSSFIMRLDLALTIFSVVNIAIITSVITAVGVYLGSFLADFESSDPLEFLLGSNGLFYIAICAFYILAVLFLEALPVALYMSGELAYLGSTEWLLVGGICLFIVIFSFLYAWYPFRLSKRYLASIDIPAI